MSKNVEEYFACDVFNDEVMKARLPKAVYKALTKTRKLGVPLDPTYAVPERLRCALLLRKRPISKAFRPNQPCNPEFSASGLQNTCHPVPVPLAALHRIRFCRS